MNWEEIVNEIPAEAPTREQQIDATFRWVVSEYTTAYHKQLTAWLKRGEITALEAMTLFKRWQKLVEGME